jgi:hypothetical protein
VKTSSGHTTAPASGSGSPSSDHSSGSSDHKGD